MDLVQTTAQLLLVDFIEFILLSFSVFGRRSVECHGG
jgi:hypothetical protein